MGLAGVSLLILANGFFVAGEFALVAVDRERLRRLAEDGHRGAQTTLAGVRSLSFQLSGAQLGITVTSLLVGFLAEPSLAVALRPLVDLAGLPDATSVGLSITVALVLATATQMVVGELIPKNLAIARPFEVAFKIVGPLRVVNRMWRPLILFLNGAANWTVRRLGIEPREELTDVRSLQELELLIHASRAGGALVEEEFALLARSISFKDRTASDIMVPRTQMIALPADATVAEVASASVDTGHSRFPMYGADLDDLLGIVHVRDVHRIAPDERTTRPARSILRDAFIVPESMALEPLLVAMRRARQLMAVAVDEYGGTSGIVTMEDIVEEIVGEIEDEHDPSRGAVAPGHPLASGVHVLDGGLHAGEVEAACGFRMPEGPYDTLAGFLLWLFERIPKTGEHVSHEGWEFKVVEMDRRRITKVLAVAAPAEPTGDGAH